MAVLNQNDGTLKVNMNPVGSTYRGIFAKDFNAGDISREDWQRAEQSANNQLARDMYMAQYSNAFNASEAEKQRSFEERVSSTAYSRAVEDMKRAGINPQIALSNGANAASTPQGATAQASSSRGSSSTPVGVTSAFGMAQVFGLIATAGKLAMLGKELGLKNAVEAGKLANKSAETALKRSIHETRTAIARSNYRNGNKRNVRY